MAFSDVSSRSPFRQTADSMESFYQKVILWLFADFAIAGAATWLIGPLVPPSLMIGLSIALIVVLLAAGFSRRASKFAGLFSILVPTVIGIILYPALNNFFSTGNGDVVYMAAFGTAAVFGSMAVVGWISKKSLNRFLPVMFGILIGVIVVSLLNAFLFHLSGLSLLISIVTLVLFSVYSYIDIQRIRDRSDGDAPASMYALNVFLDIVNIFTSLLNILGFVSRD